MHRRIIISLPTLIAFPRQALSEGRSSEPSDDVRVTEEDGFQTFTFKLIRSEIAKHPQGGDLLLVWFGGRWNGKDTALAMTLDLEWEPPKKKSPFPVWLGLVGFASVGAPSDHLVEELAKSLGQGEGSRSAVEDLVLETVTLGVKPTKKARVFKAKAIRTDAGSYGEFYFSVDLNGKRVAISEKDTEYRRSLVSAFTQPR